MQNIRAGRDPRTVQLLYIGMNKIESSLVSAQERGVAHSESSGLLGSHPGKQWCCLELINY